VAEALAEEVQVEDGKKTVVKRPANPRFFFSAKEKDHIIKCIRETEKETSGEIRIHLARKINREILHDASRTFERIGMTKTHLRNGVMIYFAVKNRQFAILGDAGIHEKMSDDCWKEISAKMESHFRNDDFAGGMEYGIKRIGDTLKEHFPYKPENGNGLPDDISFDK
jgi:uncharacterized membrane protein